MTKVNANMYVLSHYSTKRTMSKKIMCCFDIINSSQCFGDVKFKVFTVQTGEEVGVIAKQWTGLFKEALTDADNFNISFPVDLDVRVKATLLGALFLIDFMYFEQGNENNDS